MAQRSSFWSSAASASSSGVPAVDLAATSIPHCGSDILPYLFGVVLANAATGLDDDDDVEQLHVPPWTANTFDRKGLGAIASKDLELGSLLIAERPLCIWPTTLDAAQARQLFEQLGEREQAAYMSLAPVVAADADLDEIRSRRAANGFSIALPPVPGYSASKTVAMMFPKISRINHSCTPNASQVMNFMTLRMEVYATTEIPCGTEVTIEYVPGLITMSRAERQAALYDAFGFENCLCQVCSGTSADVAQSDARRNEIKQLSESLEGRKDREVTMAKLERIRILLAEEGFRGLPAFGADLRSCYLLVSGYPQRVMPNSRLDGLNELLHIQPSPLHQTSNPTTLSANHLDELANAQHSLDLWATTVFQTNSVPTPPARSDPLSFLLPPASTSTSLFPAPAEPLEMVAMGSPFDWASLYPDAFDHGHVLTAPPPIASRSSGYGGPDAQYTPFGPSGSVPLAPCQSLREPSQPPQDNGSSSSKAASPRRTRSRHSSKARSRASSESAQNAETSSVVSKETMTPEEIEEDKRRRNTEASARFRAKKKQRNVALQHTAAELRERVAELEKEKEALTTQNRWLRDIISEKAEVNPPSGHGSIQG
ncbi:uncharacterized protein JCM15063_001806 [Sporobolomyces koalae]|uniref:uncharacterized protein n=1 Tax=Sporobolomyces koalae TaxID=500713 RepID=UPI00317DAB27